MSKTLILMQGVPGSGKSTIVRGLCAGGDRHAFVFSTDDFWYDEDGKYNFDPSQLGHAHRRNQVKAEAAMRSGVDTVIIDNTNIKRRDAKPYLDLAVLYGYEVQVVRVSVRPHVALERNALRPEDRRVPDAAILRMHSEMEDLL